MAEQTVSRKHAMLMIEDNKCYISDSESKYGTLLYE
jgi:pSer/pThr/pTyr-binding forkhead associated (FHA) protein